MPGFVFPPVRGNADRLHTEPGILGLLTGALAHQYGIRRPNIWQLLNGKCTRAPLHTSLHFNRVEKLGDAG